MSAGMVATVLAVAWAVFGAWITLETTRRFNEHLGSHFPTLAPVTTDVADGVVLGIIGACMWPVFLYVDYWHPCAICGRTRRQWTAP